MSDGERVIVLGWDRATETPLWWQRDGLSWQGHSVPPADFGGPSELGEWVEPRGVVAVGQTGLPNSGRMPAFWHLGHGVEVGARGDPPCCRHRRRRPRGRAVRSRMTCWGLMSADDAVGRNLLLAMRRSRSRAGLWPAMAATPEPKGGGKQSGSSQPADRARHPPGASSVGCVGQRWMACFIHRCQGPKPPLARWLEITGHFDDPGSGVVPMDPNAGG